MPSECKHQQIRLTNISEVNSGQLLPQTKTEFRKHAFLYVAWCDWNKLTMSIPLKTTLCGFKSALTFWLPNYFFHIFPSQQIHFLYFLTWHQFFSVSRLLAPSYFTIYFSTRTAKSMILFYEKVLVLCRRAVYFCVKNWMHLDSTKIIHTKILEEISESKFFTITYRQSIPYQFVW